ncbi:MAG: cation transporter [Bacteroidetes bacterium]|nr:MAG: cation transporter [Bacteroidota bacterium]
MEQQHHHHTTAENIKIAFALNLGFAILELIGGLAFNSVAILSDALHDLGDSISLGLAWFFENFSNRESDEKYPYGYGRFSLLSALINAIVLVLGSYIILSEAIKRLLEPEPTQPLGMIGFALLGILVNGAAALRLKNEESQNAKIVGWHLIEDVIGWIAVLIGGILMLLFDLPFIDPVLAIILSIYVLYNVLKNLQETLGLFLQRTPKNIDIDLLKGELCNCANVSSVHDTRIWSLDGERHVLSTHLVIAEDASKEDILRIKRECKGKLMSTPHIAHVTIEIEYPGESCPDNSTDLIF